MTTKSVRRSIVCSLAAIALLVLAVPIAKLATSSSAANYPGNAGATTTPLAAGATRVDNWLSPGTATPTWDGVTDTSFSVRVTSDQPIGVGANFWYFEPRPVACVQVK
ncbi:MAG TPA: hypothetical protein VJT71_10895 [Pyrinomonadaceae bacterium]|nr:hypothetical protein [Pyrinomonadaceae bacterium]